MTLIEKIGANIKKLRTAKDMSQHELSRESGISLSLINWVECGKRNNITIKTIEKLAKALGTDFYTLVE